VASVGAGGDIATGTPSIDCQRPSASSAQAKNSATVISASASADFGSALMSGS